MSSSYWKTVLTHESGHAAAALAILDEAADIFVKAPDSSGKPYSAAHRMCFSFVDLQSGKLDPAKAIIVLAAGAKAEAICLGIPESAGFAGDFAKIRDIRAKWETKCSEAYWRTFRWPEEEINKALKELPAHQSKLREIVAEIDSDYSRTAAIIQGNREVIEMLATEAHEFVQSVGEHSLVDSQILLSADRIQEIWDTKRRGQVG